MNDFLRFVSHQENSASDQTTVDEASACLDRFTAAFNAQDLVAMDTQLHFPHVMVSGAETMIWHQAGQHPADFFVHLQKTGWASTQYESKEPVLVSADKVHFLVAYTRQSRTGTVLSHHTNLWVVVRKAGRWGIALRSY